MTQRIKPCTTTGVAGERHHADERGFTVLEMAFASVVLVVGAMSFVTTVVSSSVLSQQAYSRSVANVEMVSAIENFRKEATEDFEDVIGNMSVGVIDTKMGQSEGVTVKRHVVLNETDLNPPVDLNGDGDTLDTDLSPDELIAAYLLTTVSWSDSTGEHEKHWTTMVARGEVDPHFDAEAHKTAVEEAELKRELELAERPIDYDQQLADQVAKGILSADVASASGNTVKFAFDLPGDKPLYVVGVAVHTDSKAAVERIRVEGSEVFRQRLDLPPIGEVIHTEPFRVDPGHVIVDELRLNDSSQSLDLQAMPVAVVFYGESGNKIVVNVTGHVR